MIIALTGASGSIGKELLPFLETSGHSVIQISSSLQSNGYSIFSYEDLNNKDLDIKVDVLIHLASLNSELTKNNIEQELKLTEEVLNLLKNIHCRKLVFFSSAKVYGDNSFQNLTFFESSNRNPTCSYGKAKMLCEDLIFKKSQELDLEFIIFRLPPVLNQSDKSNLGRLIKYVHKGGTMVSFKHGDLNQRSFISFNNIETVIHYVLKEADLTFSNQIYNLADDEYISLHNLLNILNKKKILVLPRVLSNLFFKLPFLKNIFLKLYGNFVLDNSKLKVDMGVKIFNTEKSIKMIFK